MTTVTFLFYKTSGFIAQKQLKEDSSGKVPPLAWYSGQRPAPPAASSSRDREL